MFNFLQGLFRWPKFLTITYSYRLTEDGITRHDSDGTIKQVNWNDVSKISIVTTDQGPFVDDFYYVFCTDQNVLFVPLDWGVKLELIHHMHEHFPNVDFEAMIKASGSAENAEFFVWARGAEQPAQAL